MGYPLAGVPPFPSGPGRSIPPTPTGVDRLKTLPSLILRMRLVITLNVVNKLQNNDCQIQSVTAADISTAYSSCKSGLTRGILWTFSVYFKIDKSNSFKTAEIFGKKCTRCYKFLEACKIPNKGTTEMYCIDD